ncbi:MAG: flagellar assembly peptidoglycan hydrolase FlgJ, partial [Methylococcaceae bacterium]|nr:flagellar assembly peptidoglycan hydrolase FlgJ [Methylococcaceae bacterium]
MIKQSGPADVYTDFHGLAQLKGQARQNSPEALKKVSRQFESLFLQMAMKSMRQATIKSDLMNSSQADTYREMYDQQMALELGKRSRLGLADMIERQMGGAKGDSAATAGKNLNEYRKEAGLPMQALDRGSSDAAGASKLQAVQRQVSELADSVRPPLPAGRRGAFSSPEEFVQELWPHAKAAADELGVDPKMLLAQAALESGWGKSVMRTADGGHSHNLFGIKADRSWVGRSVAARTVEVENGLAVRKNAAFRAYDSYTDSFR